MRSKKTLFVAENLTLPPLQISAFANKIALFKFQNSENTRSLQGAKPTHANSATNTPSTGNRERPSEENRKILSSSTQATLMALPALMFTHGTFNRPLYSADTQ
jgi:hypothetical protein